MLYAYWNPYALRRTFWKNYQDEVEKERCHKRKGDYLKRRKKRHTAGLCTKYALPQYNSWGRFYEPEHVHKEQYQDVRDLLQLIQGKMKMPVGRADTDTEPDVHTHPPPPRNGYLPGE